MNKSERTFELLVAFGTDDGEHLNKDHVGMAKIFLVYKFTDAIQELVQTRENSKFKGDETIKHGDPKKAKATASVLQNIDVLVGKRFGPNLTRLIKKLLCVITRVDRIDASIQLIHDNIELILEECKKGEDRKHLILTP